MLANDASKNNHPVKYVADHPADRPVNTMYPHVSTRGGHFDESMASSPASMNSDAQNWIGATRSTAPSAFSRFTLASVMMYCTPMRTNKKPTTARIVL